jgi:hypothetical protein
VDTGQRATAARAYRAHGRSNGEVRPRRFRQRVSCRHETHARAGRSWWRSPACRVLTTGPPGGIRGD